jgi:XisH protein
MPAKDQIHDIVKEALLKDGWQITNDPYVISYGERFLFVDLAAISSPIPKPTNRLIAAVRNRQRIAIEIKDFRGQSTITDLERTLGQYLLYRLILSKIEPEIELYLAISNATYRDIFSEPIGQLVITEIPLKLIIIDVQTAEIQAWL